MIRGKQKGFFQFKLILAVSTACLFVKPGQMCRVTAEELFPQGSEAGRKRQHQLEYHEFFTPGMYI